MPKKRALLDWIKIERHASTQLQHQVSDQIRAAIRSGRLSPGTPLPSSRTLAANLEVARGTATVIYDRLIGEGWLDVRERSAIFVADGIEARSAGKNGRTAAANFDALKEAIRNDEGLPPPYTHSCQAYLRSTFSRPSRGHGFSAPAAATCRWTSPARASTSVVTRLSAPHWRSI